VARPEKKKRLRMIGGRGRTEKKVGGNAGNHADLEKSPIKGLEMSVKRRGQANLPWGVTVHWGAKQRKKKRQESQGTTG